MMRNQLVKIFVLMGSVLLGTLPVSVSGSDKPAFSGFLGDYTAFKESKRIKGAWVYFKPGKTIKDLKQYNKILLEPVQVYGGSDAVFKDVDPVALKKAASDFHRIITRTLEKDGYKVVSGSGNDVLKMRVALTGTDPKKRKYGVAGYIPVALAFRMVKAGAQAATDKKEIQLEVSMEADFIDSTSNERLFAAVDNHLGSSATVDEKNPDIDEKNMHDAFKFWASELRDRMNEAHGKGEQYEEYDY